MMVITFLIHEPILDIILLILAGLLIIFFFKIRAIIFEFAGGCVTVRKTHPLTYRKFIAPEFEMPSSSVRHLVIIKGFCFTKLRLSIKSNREQRYTFKIKFLGLSDKQKQKLEHSIKVIID